MKPIRSNDEIGMDDFPAVQRYGSVFGTTLDDLPAKMNPHGWTLAFADCQTHQLVVHVLPVAQYTLLHVRNPFSTQVQSISTRF
jgi:hypothetical protein